MWAFFFQIALIVHFAVRKRFFETYTLKFGWIIYALCIPALIVSLILMRAGKPWYFWLGGFLCLLFATFGYYIDYIRQIPWRDPGGAGHYGPLRNALSFDDHVLLVASAADQPPALVRLCRPVYHQHDPEHIIALKRTYKGCVQPLQINTRFFSGS